MIASKFLLAIVACSPLLLACGDVDNQVEPGPSVANPLDSQESALLKALNDRRTGAGLPAAVQCATLNVSSSKHSDDMRDRGYLDDVAPDGSTPATRACEAGYQAACGGTIAMAELVASGVEDGPSTLGQWTKKADTDAILMNPDLVVAGVGRADGGEVPFWTLDLGGAADASCSQ